LQTPRLRVRFWSTKTTAKIKVGLALLAIMWLQLLFGILNPATSSAQAATGVPPTVSAKAAIAVDTTTGRILYRKNIHDRLPMASTTKLTTALTALNVPGVNLDDKVIIIKSDMVGEASMGLRLNETVTFQDLLWGMLINSGNDAAQTIARYAGSKLPGNDDPVARFVAQMNRYAGKDGLDLLNSHYTNPHGLDEDNHYTSAYDLSRIGWYALHASLLSKIVGTQQAVVAGHSLNNLNTFLKKYPGAIGLKPGFTDNAGLCLVAAAQKNGHIVITVVLNSADINADSATLMNYTFSLLESNSGNGGVSQGGPGMSLLTKGDPSQYIGYPNGDKLLSPDQSSVQANPNNPAALSTQIAASRNIAADDKGNAYSFGQVVNAQVSGATPDASLTPTSGNGGTSQPDTSQSKSGGPNLLVLLLIVLVILGILYVVARLGYLGGETGRNLAYRVEDGVLGSGRALRRLLGQLRPGNDNQDTNNARPPYRSQLPPPRTGGDASSDVNYRDRVQGGVARPTQANPSQPSNYSNSGRFAPSGESRPQPSSRPPLNYQSPPSPPRVAAQDTNADVASTNPNRASGAANPLEGFFDDVAPFSFEERENTRQTDEQDFNTKPPQPLRAPFNNPAPKPSSQTSAGSFSVRADSLRDNPVPPRPAPSLPKAEPQLPSPQTGYNQSSPQPEPPRPQPTVRPSSRPVSSTNAGSAASNLDNISKRAQQAMDYAFAGRMQASTDEFRRVVEQDPLYDFGNLDDFDQMPVLGYKALASAYSAAGKSQFGILLLDLAIEKFPNDLELRNMLRSFKRETGQ